MNARPRKRGTKDLPMYLTRDGNYWRYRHPKATRVARFPIAQKQRAIEFAREANRRFSKIQEGQALERFTGLVSPTVTEIINKFRRHYIPQLGVKPSTARGYDSQLRRLESDIGLMQFSAIDQRFLTNYLREGFKGNGYTKARGLLSHVYKYAISEGWVSQNYAAGTLTAKPEPKKTQPHTLEGLNEIIAVAEPWLRNAITIAMSTCLRPNDIRDLLSSNVDRDQRTIKVAVGKTTNYEKPVHLEIFFDDLLFDGWDAVSESLQSPIICPYLICYQPKRQSSKQASAKPHWAYVTKGVLSKAFRDARDQSGAYEKLEVEQRPSFREIRNFGAQQLRNADYPESFIQKLLGHTKAETTQIYLDDGKPTFEQVRISPKSE